MSRRVWSLANPQQPLTDSIIVESDHGGPVILVDDRFCGGNSIRVFPDAETSQERRAKIREIAMSRRDTGMPTRADVEEAKYQIMRDIFGKATK